jgi:two-component system OmpR family sensor kinase
VSIRWRLALSFALLLAIPTVIASLFFYVALRNWTVARDVDSNLKAYSTLAVLPLATENVDYGLALTIWDSFADKSVQIQLVDSERNVVLKSQNLGDEALPTDIDPVDNAFNGTSTISEVRSNTGGSLRVLALRVPIREEVYVLEIGRPLPSYDVGMALALMLIVLVFLALSFISAAILIGRALSPVKEVTATAQSITSSSDLSRRVNYHGPKDEIGQLAATFDQMIEQLDWLMRSQRSFVADASHELRGPLTVIRGNVDLLKRNLSEEDRSESIRVLEAEMTRMTRVVNDLLVLAEVESGQLDREQTVSLKELLLDAHERALQLAGERQVVIERQEDLRVKGDAHRLDQLIGNLVGNAIKYTHERGTVTLSLYQDGDWARLDVADTGMGIPAEHLPHIFERFYRVDKARSRRSGGSGLGLAIVKGIAEQHGGKVSVTSEPGKGSTFSVWLRL